MDWPLIGMKHPKAKGAGMKHKHLFSSFNKTLQWHKHFLAHVCCKLGWSWGAQKHTKAYFKVAAWDETGMTSTHTEIPRFLKRGLGRKKKHCSSQLHPRLKKTLGWKAPTLKWFIPHPRDYYTHEFMIAVMISRQPGRPAEKKIQIFPKSKIFENSICYNYKTWGLYPLFYYYY